MRTSLSKTKIFYISTLTFVVSIGLASFFPFIAGVSEFIYFSVLIISVVLLIICKRKIYFLFLVFLFLGLWRYSLSLPLIDESHIASINGQNVVVKGVIVSDVVSKDSHQNFELELKDYNGKIMVYANAFPVLSYGDEIAFRCEFAKPEPFDGFNYDRYLARLQIYSICFYPDGIQLLSKDNGNIILTKIFIYKNSLAKKIEKGLDFDTSQLARAMLLGESKNMNEELRNSFSRTGLSHIVAISGLHIGIIAGIIAWILFKIGLSRNKIFYFSQIILWVYIVLVGMPASAMRAGLMVGLFVFAIKLGRFSQVDRILIFSACVLLLVNPRLLRDDIGFQLSFVCVLGIIYLYPLVNKLLIYFDVTNKFKIRDLLNVSLSAQIVSLPIVSYYFEIISVFSVVANILVIWLLPFLLCVLIIALLVPFFGQIFFFVAQVLIDFIITVSQIVGTLPFSSIEYKFNIIFIIIFYSFLAWIILASKKGKILIYF
ncbi:hypothetical protein C0583_05540 [Candidatus Parcubacteria bacterium]|nr:MAG: hypothetical protein C0583_05540 [Candidatus Parcubacteria bacterium]